ncbi:MAG: hypothetical protein RML94_14150 [Bacteroidia bacterium]|nr:hypothetical protein [Bacteroidia bacterium]
MSKIKPDKKLVFNPVSNTFEYISDNNFSYLSVPANKTLKIPQNMQMVVYNGFILDGIVDLQGVIILEL